MPQPEENASAAQVRSRRVRIPMRDGVELSAEIFFPDSAAPAPAIIKYYPYRKDDVLRGLAVPRADYFCSHGYVTALLDVRGTGSSAGISDRMMRLQEWEDGYDAVEWIAAQAWCTGSVAMTGVSYGGFSALLTAAQAPPHLKAIAPIYAGWDLYENSHPGGMWQIPIWAGLYNAMMTALGAAPPGPDDDGRWLDVWEEHLAGNRPWLEAWMRDQTDGPNWREGSVRYGLENIECATFVFGSWHDIFVSDPFQIYAGLRDDVPKKLTMGPYLHMAPNIGVPGPRYDHLHEIVRWFDYHVKGEDTGIAAEPPIAIWVRDYDHPSPARNLEAGYWRSEAEWPPARAEDMTYYLDSEGALTEEPPAPEPGTGVSYRYDPAIGSSTMGLLTGLGQDVGLPLDQRRDASGSVVCLGLPLDAQLEVSGYPRLTLFASSTAEVTAFSVKLVDVHPDGPWALVSRAVLNTAQRKSRTDPESLVPGEVAELEIELEAVSYTFQEGHRIGLMIASSDFPLVWPLPQPAVNTVFMDADHATRLTIPFVRQSDSGLDAPAYREAPPLPEALGAAEPLRWDLVESLSGTKVSVSMSFGGEATLDNGTWISTHAELEATTNRDDPARSRVHASYDFELKDVLATTRIRATSTVQGTEESFHGVTSVDVHTNEMPRFSRTWSQTIPRGFL